MSLTKEQKELAVAQLEAMEKELKRREAEEIGEEHRGKIVERAEEAISDTPRALVEDVPIAFAQGATYDFADEVVGKLAEYKSQSKDPRELEEIYKEARDAMRAKTEDARTKSPVLTFLAESLGEQVVGGKVVGAAMKGVRKLGPLGRGLAPVPGVGSTREAIIKTGAQGVGASQEEGIQDRGSNVVSGGISAGVGAAQNLAGRSILGIFGDPNRLRAKAVGFPRKQYLKEGSEYFDPMLIVESANKQKFFSPESVEFNSNTLNFKPSTKGRKLSQGYEQEGLRLRAEEAIDKIREKVIKSLSASKSARKLYTSKDLVPELQSQKMQAVSQAVDQKKAADLWDKEIQTFVDNIDAQPIQGVGTLGVGITDIYDWKEKYQRAAAQAYKRLEDPASQDSAEVREAIARSLRKFVEQEASDAADIKNLNKVATQYHQLHKSLSGALAASSDPAAQPRTLMEKLTVGALEKVGTTPGGRLRRAEIGEGLGSAMSKFPSGQTAAARDVNRLMYGKDSSLGIKGIELSVDAAFGGQKPIAEQVIRTKLPRDSQRFLEMKNLVKMKIAQQMPEQFDYVQDVLDNSPEEVPRILPLLIKAVPHFFAPDEYDRIDGKVTTPAGRFKAEKRIDDLDLPNHKKVEMKDRLFKTGEFNDN